MMQVVLRVPSLPSLPSLPSHDSGLPFAVAKEDHPCGADGDEHRYPEQEVWAARIECGEVNVHAHAPTSPFPLLTRKKPRVSVATHAEEHLLSTISPMNVLQPSEMASERESATHSASASSAVLRVTDPRSTSISLWSSQ